MLFHVILTHSVEDCPGFNRDKMPETLAAADKMDELAEQCGVKVLYLVSGLPEHVEYALVEADDQIGLANFFSGYPYRLSFKVTPVVHMKDAVAKMKEVLAQQKQ